MRLVTWVTAVLVASGAAAGCGSAGQPVSEPDAGLLAEATAPAGSTCPKADALTALLGATGVSHDYEPSDSPRGLALTTEAVVRGRLTGHAEPVVGAAGPALDLGIDVQDVVLGEELNGMTPPLSRLRLTVAPPQLPGADTSVPALQGLEVVAFITLAPDGQQEPGVVGVPAAPEGLMASCGHESLVGWHGDGPAWAVSGLDDVSLAALGLPDDTAALEGVWEQAGGEGPTLEVSRGPEHCDWESTITAGVGNDRMFVRDPEGVAAVDLVGSLDLAASPPVGDLTVVWEHEVGHPMRFALVDGEDGLAVDLGGGRWERWPEVLPMVGCA